LNEISECRPCPFQKVFILPPSSSYKPKTPSFPTTFYNEKHEAHPRQSQPLTNQLLEHTIEATLTKQTSLRMPERPENDSKLQAQQMELPAQDAGRTVAEQPVSSPAHQTQLHYSNQYCSAQLRKWPCVVVTSAPISAAACELYLGFRLQTFKLTPLFQLRWPRMLRVSQLLLLNAYSHAI
jgi:hypothetical protein